MKTLHPDLLARFSSDVTTLCLGWILRRRDGHVIGITDHDRAIEIDGQVLDPGAGLEAISLSQTSDHRPGQAMAEGVLSAEALTAADLQSGLWNRARIEVFRFDWTAPQLGSVPVWSGLLSEVAHRPDGSFSAELVSLKAELERPIGRRIMRRCDAELGDPRCGVRETGGLTCDQRFETCRDVFQNTMNFRGFPHLPGPDALLAGPGAGPQDGGRR